MGNNGMDSDGSEWEKWQEFVKEMKFRVSIQ